MPGRARNARFEVTPSAARLTDSLRDIGYDFPTAVADLVDNSIAAGASRVEVDVEFDGLDSSVSLADDGWGMTANQLLEALRFGTRRNYGPGDLGRYGLGLKTAPLSQGRRLTVVTRRSAVNQVITRRTLDLDVIADWDRWLILEEPMTPHVDRAVDRLRNAPGTVVIWEKLDRVLPKNRQDGGWAKRRLASMANKTAQHLGMVFHRFLEGRRGAAPMVITVNGEKVQPWNPFAPDEPATLAMPSQRFEVSHEQGVGQVRLRGYVLPSRDKFSSPAEFERLSGPLKWNRQQGLYVYRADRLVQWGGWNGVRAIDEHVKLARAALDFDTDLDHVFHINVAKMRVSIPVELRQMIERPIHELCIRADDAYRKTDRRRSTRTRVVSEVNSSQAALAGVALRSVAIELGYGAALREVVAILKEREPALVSALGLD